MYAWSSGDLAGCCRSRCARVAARAGGDREMRSAAWHRPAACIHSVAAMRLHPSTCARPLAPIHFLKCASSLAADPTPCLACLPLFVCHLRSRGCEARWITSERHMPLCRGKWRRGLPRPRAPAPSWQRWAALRCALLCCGGLPCPALRCAVLSGSGSLLPRVARAVPRAAAVLSARLPGCISSAHRPVAPGLLPAAGRG